MWSILSRLWAVGWQEQGRARKWLAFGVAALPWLGTTEPVKWLQARTSLQLPEGFSWFESLLMTNCLLAGLMGWRLAKQVVDTEADLAELQEEVSAAADAGLRAQLREKGKSVELVVINVSTRTIEDVRVSIPNVRTADGKLKREFQKDMVSVDGRKAPMKLNPTEQPSFAFARSEQPTHGPWEISLYLGDGAPRTKTHRQEVSVKFRITGRDVSLPRLDVLVTCDPSTGNVTAKPWNPKHRFASVVAEEWKI